MCQIQILTIICVLISCHSLAIAGNDFRGQDSLETYIVHVELPQSLGTQIWSSSSSNSNEDLDNWYRSFLPTTVSSSNEEPRMVYSYHNVFKGFAAKLSPEDVKEMEKKPGFISAQPQKMLSLHTTHSPDFLGLHQNMGFWAESNYGKGIIVGVLDSGITPEHPSFRDEGMPPPPAKWKGKCEFNTSVCNNKLIGARYFRDGNGSPMDEAGHGTHTASTAAGNYVKGANVFGNANGTAVGVAPLAHLATYKVCGSTGCSESDIVAALDKAIDDGVDILSMSLQGGSGTLYSDNIAIGSYSAMKRGIFVSCSAGNSGPSHFTLSNQAPWILTVGASTIDRKIRAIAILGNNKELEGEYLYHPKNFPSSFFPLIYPGMVKRNSSFRYCDSTIRKMTEVRGKIVVCEYGSISRFVKGENVKKAGGVGMILINQLEEGYTTLSDAHVLPAIHLSYVDGVKVLAYINSTRSPTAAISFKGTVIGDNRAPVVASFSSRGPNTVSPGILKPDIIGPGVNILAAWNRSVENHANTRSTFNVISGTSMSCPHLSGVAALLKSSHPNWSPAAIKSAIMTTADVVNLAMKPIEDQTFHPADLFATGSGHVNPARANNPGLIYDIKPTDYIPYLCGLNYTSKNVEIIVQRRVNCTTESSIPEAQLNYPSFSVFFGQNVQTYTRTVTNVGEANSVYTVEVVQPEGVDIKVKPDTLRFSKLNQKLTYKVSFSLKASANETGETFEGSLTWTSGAKYSVRSPILVANIGGN